MIYEFDRTENGTTKRVSKADALAEINHAMMGGKRDVKRMSSGTVKHSIEYRDGRHVVLVRVLVDDVPQANVVAVTGGEVHQMSAWTTPGRVYAMCRPSARTVYRETSAPVTCDVCCENIRRASLK